MILFLTDGEPSDDDRNLIFKTIRDRNLELNNSVTIFTFGIGAVNQEILTDIAIQNTTKYGFPRNISVGDITVGLVLSRLHKAVTHHLTVNGIPFHTLPLHQNNS